MDIIFENKFYYPERNKISHIIDKTLNEYAQNHENSPWHIDCKYNVQFFDKIKNKTRNLSTKRGIIKTITALNGRYQYIQIYNFMISIKGEIKKDVINTYMKCFSLPLLWRKLLSNILNNRDYINNYCNRPLNKVDKHLPE